jgi:hypothetical protein
MIGIPTRADASYVSEGMTSAVLGLVVTAEHLRHCFTMPAQVKGVTGNYSYSVQVQYCNTALLEFN